MSPHAVSWLFLVESAVAAAFAANALRPIFGNRYLATLSFFAGWLTSELPLHHAAWQALVALGFVGAGALSAWPGWLALALTVLSLAGLALAGARALAAHGVLEAALEEALDDGTLPEQPPRAAVLAEWRRRILAPIPVGGVDVDRVRDIVFHEVGGVRLKLDVYRRPDRPMRCPTLLFVHGGAWVLGSKDHHGLPLVQHFAARGWTCLSINYRLSPRFVFPDHLEDVKRALRWARTEGVKHGVDPDFIVVAGGSAGGHLAALAALTATATDGADAVAGCVAFYGVYDMTDEAVWPHQGLSDLLEQRVFQRTRASDPGAFERASPIHRVHEGAPPFLVLHGDCDSMVPVEEARRFTAALRAVSRAPVAYAELPGAQHAFEVFPSLRTALVVDGMGRFVTWLHRRHQAAAAAAAAAPSPETGRAEG
jgi:acetyl esterase/lipase